MLLQVLVINITIWFVIVAGLDWFTWRRAGWEQEKWQRLAKAAVFSLLLSVPGALAIWFGARHNIWN